MTAGMSISSSSTTAIITPLPSSLFDLIVGASSCNCHWGLKKINFVIARNNDNPRRTGALCGRPNLRLFIFWSLDVRFEIVWLVWYSGRYSNGSVRHEIPSTDSWARWWSTSSIPIRWELNNCQTQSFPNWFSLVLKSCLNLAQANQYLFYSWRAINTVKTAIRSPGIQRKLEQVLLFSAATERAVVKCKENLPKELL